MLSYELPDESGDDLCRDLTDNDLDGLIDCVDPGCVGLCAESISAGQCLDGLDNDLDGLPDRLDPDCWVATGLDPTPYVFARCASVAGSFYPDLSGLREVWSGDGAWTPDRSARFPDEVYEFGLGDAIASHRTLLTGALEGTSIAFSLLPGGATEVTTRLTQVGQVAVELTFEMKREGSSWLGVLAGGGLNAPEHLRLPYEADDAWVDVDLVMLAASVRVRVTGGGETVEFPETPTALGRAAAFRLSVERSGGAPSTLLGHLSVTRPKYDPCGRPMPSALPGTGVRLAGFAMSPAYACAIVEDLADGKLSTVRGLHRTREDPLSGLVHEPPVWDETTAFGLELEQVLGNPVVAWDERSATFRLAAPEHQRRPDGTHAPTGQVLLASSRDCTSWDLLGHALASRLGATETSAFVLGFDIDDRTDENRLYLTETSMSVEGGLPTDRRVRVWSSLSGEPGSFRITDTVVPFSTATNRPYRHPRVLVTGVRGDLLWLDGDRSYGYLHRNSDNPLPFFGPSETPGTFDEGVVEQGLLWLASPPPVEPPWNGLLVYTARRCAACSPELGAARFRLLRYTP